MTGCPMFSRGSYGSYSRGSGGRCPLRQQSGGVCPFRAQARGCPLFQMSNSCPFFPQGRGGGGCPYRSQARGCPAFQQRRGNW